VPTNNLPATASAAEILAEKLENYPILDPETIDERTMLKTLSAASAEDVGAMPDTASLDSITGEPFYLLGIEGCLPSEIKGRADDFYYLLACKWDDGRHFTASTGSRFCITRAIRWDELGALPRRVMSVSLESKRDSSRTSLWLVDAPLRAAAGATAPLDATARAISAAAADGPGEAF
jgi:hypothetical protein